MPHQMNPATPDRRTRELLLRLALFAGVSLLTRAVSFWIPILDRDEASYMVQSWEVLRGGLLYVQAADHHPPFTPLYYALAQLLLGKGMFAVRLLTTLAVLPLTAFAASAFFGHDRRGLIAGLAYLVSGASFIGHSMLAVNCEPLMLLPMAWALVLLRDETAARSPRRIFLAGLLLSAGILFKYQAGFWVPAAAVAILRLPCAERQWRPAFQRMGALAAGTALPPAALYAFYLARGAGAEFLSWNVTMNLGYLSVPPLFREAWGRGLSYLAPFLLATSLLWWGSLRTLRRPAPAYRKLLFTALLACSLVPAFLGFRFYPHYFIQLYFPLALASAPAWEEILRRPFTRPALAGLAVTLCLFLGFTAGTAYLYFVHPGSYEETRPICREVAARLRRDPGYGQGSLFVWGYEPMFYYHAGLPLATRFVFIEETLVGYMPGNSAATAGLKSLRSCVLPRHWDWLMQDLERNRPAFILDTTTSGLRHWERYPISAYPRLRDFVERNYEREDAIDGVVIYRRLGCGG
jgi:hypothetical protein